MYLGLGPPLRYGAPQDAAAPAFRACLASLLVSFFMHRQAFRRELN